MCCMQNKSNTKWLFTCRTLEDDYLIMQQIHVIYVRGTHLEMNGGFSGDVHAVG